MRLIPRYDCFATAVAGEWFDENVANRYVAFFAECLTHIEGELAESPFLLEPWQKAVVGCLFGWRKIHKRTGREIRRYREALLYVPRKNGKTPLAAGIGNAVMFLDGEKGAQGYCLASDAEQAALLFRQVRGQIENEPELKSRAIIYGGEAGNNRRAIYKETNGFLAVQSGDADNKHGGNSHLVEIDELHVQPNRQMVDTVRTSFASENRLQPLLLMITTADHDRESICNEIHDYATKICDGKIEDSAFLPVIYEAQPNDDWKSEHTWRKANPNLGVSVSLEYLHRECKRAQETPAYENTFKRLHLNMKTQQDIRWLSLEQWDACSDLRDREKPEQWLVRKTQEYAGREAVAAVDLSSISDLTARVLLFRDDDDGYTVLPAFWLPQLTANDRDLKDRIPYLTWARQGFIHLSEGNRIDYRLIRKNINEASKIYPLKEIAFDPWNAQQLATQLGEEDDFNMTEFRQGFISMNEPCKELERLIGARKLRHGGNPVLRWMAGNVAVKVDESGNIRPDKKRSSEKIDGIVALVMAIGRAMLQTPSTEDVTIRII